MILDDQRRVFTLHHAFLRADPIGNFSMRRDIGDNPGTDEVQQVDESKGFYVSNLAAIATIDLIIFLNAAIIFQSFRLGIAVDTIGLLAQKIDKKAK